MKLTPIGNYVAVRRLETKEITDGGIIIPESAKKKSEFAMVVAVGPGKKLENGSTQEMLVKVGDKILMPYWGGNDMKIEDVSCIFIKESDIYGVCE